ncbi:MULTISPECIES: hypothetical protein [Streptomyces]|uniref:hypothetical protein n=1 Tax=Streptomyces TaxID=1883 RepID=UPI00224F386C|nr:MULTISPECIES: hypothetical protein [Streptomyces]MCX4806926.1 hypothetical protein [Streptomyces sp. NBC_01214]MCX5274886.1 hypothetical protein [Streptomyces virginiae]WSQ01845.1 hypothetical protein OG444_31795 [Streptomyces sp. NBC_01232]
MNGNPAYHAIALAAVVLLVLPVFVAILVGWTPRGLRGRRPAARPYAWALLCLYTLMPLNAVPRVLVYTGLGFVPVTAALICFIQAGRATRQTDSQRVS